MKRKVEIIPILLFVLTALVFDRFLFLPGRMEGTWDYEYGTYVGDSISFTQNIDIVDNFEIKIQDNKKLDSFYLIGCYFGNLYMLHKETLEYTKYVRYKKVIHGIN